KRLEPGDAGSRRECREGPAGRALMVVDGGNGTETMATSCAARASRMLRNFFLRTTSRGLPADLASHCSNCREKNGCTLSLHLLGVHMNFTKTDTGHRRT